jgi:hypothetical protein
VGLLRHYWVLTKLPPTLFAATIPLLEVGTVGALARYGWRRQQQPRG